VHQEAVLPRQQESYFWRSTLLRELLGDLARVAEIASHDSERDSNAAALDVSSRQNISPAGERKLQLL